MLKKLLLAGMFLSGNVSAGNIELVLELDGLGPMKNQHYEGWSILNGEALSTGRFSLNKNMDIFEVNSKGKKIRKIGKNGKAAFSVAKKLLDSKQFVLTIEPNGDQDFGPSKVHVLGGSISQGEGILSTDDPTSLMSNFNSAKGSYILAAPTGGDFNQGVWFVDPSVGASSLDLPTLPDGWAYEGWIVNTKYNKVISTGLFKDSDRSDSDGAGRFAGPFKLSFPSVPGQDIVNTPIVLNDGKHAVVISVEPYPDFDPAPYDIKILKGEVSKDSAGMTSIDLKNISHSIPSGIIHIH